MSALAAERVTQAIGEALARLFGGRVGVETLALLPGGASKEAWAVDADVDGERLELLVRRAGGGLVFSEMLSLEDEFRVLEVAYEAGVRVPRPYGYLGDVDGRGAFVMERVPGETFGTRIVRRPELASAREALPRQLATELARIHSIPLERVEFLPGPRQPPVHSRYLDQLEAQLDQLEEPHPAIELGLAWLRRQAPADRDVVLVHGDFRLGNLVVDEQGLRAVLDWEYAAVGDAAADVAWPLVRAWRFGADEHRLAGIDGVSRYLDRYNELGGRTISLEELFYWEVAGNVRWAIGALSQARRHLSNIEPSVELAMLGRTAAEVEFEILQLLGQAG